MDTDINKIKKRKQIIRKLKNKRFTYQYIGNLLQISRQRVCQIDKMNVGEIINKRKNKVRKKENKIKEREQQIQKKETDIKNGLKPNTQGIKLQGASFIREAVRGRDNHTCQICGKKWVKGKRRFDIHHIDCNKEKSRKYDNWEKERENMITLCHRCHMNLPEHRKSMSKKYRRVINR